MKIKKKIIICILICIGIILCASSNVYAAGGTVQLTLAGILDLILKLIGSVVGLYTWSIRLLIIGLSVAVQGLMSVLGMLGGGTDGFILTPYAILFNRVEAVKIDFFDFSASADFIRVFRQNIAMWYYVLRFIATGILLAILVYIGLRMAISTVAEEKAKYKKMIVDWVTSLALLYLLHYIIVFVIRVNTVFVDMIASVGDELDIGPMIIGLLGSSVSPISGIGGWAALILYIIFTWQTVKFFIMYVKRMMTIGFLILISPLITITYSIDRAGDQKAQALNTWLKEFIYNVLIQPFHCILYLAFAHAAFSTVMGDLAQSVDSGSIADAVLAFMKESVLGWGSSISGMVFAILCLVFINSGEKIIREIFGFTKASSVGDLVGAAAIATGAFKYASSIGGAASKAGGIGKVLFPGIENLGKAIQDNPIAQKISATGIGATVSGFGRTVGSGVSKVADKVVLPGGDTLGTVLRDSAQTVGNVMTDVGQKFTSKVGDIKEFARKVKDNHPTATNLFQKGGNRVIRYFRTQIDNLGDPEALKAAMITHGVGMGLANDGSLVQTAMYTTVFSSFADFIGNVSGAKQTRSARLAAEELGKSINTIEVVNNKVFSNETEVVEHIKKVEESGAMGEYEQEKISQSKYGMFRTINSSTIGGVKATHSDLVSAFMEAQKVFDSGGNGRSATMALNEELSNRGIELDTRKLGDIQRLLEDIQRKMADAKLYKAWTEMDKAGVTEEVFARALLQNKPTDPYIPSPAEPQYNGFNNDFDIIDDYTRETYNKQEDRADLAADDIGKIIRRLDRGSKADNLEIDLMKQLSEMADAIKRYQSGPNVDHVVLKKMVHTHNITAERTNRIRLNYDASKVGKLAEVKKFEETSSGSGVYVQS